MSGLSLCDLCLCYSILGSQFSNKYLVTYLLRVSTGLENLENFWNFANLENSWKTPGILC